MLKNLLKSLIYLLNSFKALKLYYNKYVMSLFKKITLFILTLIILVAVYLCLELIKYKKKMKIKKLKKVNIQ